MSQHDFNIADQLSPAFRADLNNALLALGSLSSGASAPGTTYANQLWYDTANNILKMRSEANDAWISVAYLDQSANAFRLIDGTIVTTTAGAEVVRLAAQAQGTWDTGTGVIETPISPAKLKASIETHAPTPFSDLASAAAGDVGMDAFLFYAPAGSVPVGADTSGANVWWCNASGNVTGSSPVGYGTWRAKGFGVASAGNAARTLTFTRIA